MAVLASMCDFTDGLYKCVGGLRRGSYDEFCSWFTVELCRVLEDLGHSSESIQEWNKGGKGLEKGGPCNQPYTLNQEAHSKESCRAE